MHLAAHCGVTNAVFYSFQTSHAFQTIEQDGSLQVDLCDETLPFATVFGPPEPGRPWGQLGYQIRFAASLYQNRLLSDLVLFLNECEWRTWFVVGYPSVVPSSSVAGSVGRHCSRRLPPSGFEVYFGCAVCGHYQLQRPVWVASPSYTDDPTTLWVVSPPGSGTCANCWFGFRAGQRACTAIRLSKSGCGLSLEF